jgi:type IV pilus biogenesis protein CpaD/CtpE
MYLSIRTTMTHDLHMIYDQEGVQCRIVVDWVDATHDSNDGLRVRLHYIDVELVKHVCYTWVVGGAV